MTFKVSNRTNMNTAFCRICCKELRLQIHQLYFTIAVLIYNNFAFEILRQIQKDLFLAKTVAEEENSIFHVRANDIYKALIGFFSTWEIVLWISKCVIHMQIVNIYCYAMMARIAPIGRA